MFAVRLIGVLALVALNGFFAAAEYSLVAVRLSRVRQLVIKGDIRARVVERLLADLHRVVSGVQVGMTLTSLAIGALGEATLANALQQIWHGSGSTRNLVFRAHFRIGLCFRVAERDARCAWGVGAKDREPGQGRARGASCGHAVRVVSAHVSLGHRSCWMGCPASS